MGKTKITVLYGGRSTEHEVSCRSAAFVLKTLDPLKYDIHTVAIDKNGRWLPQNTTKLLASINGEKDSLSIATGEGIAERNVLQSSGEVDHVVIPIMHGTFGEDGSMQGLLDMAEVAYVGCDTLGSSVAMDKVVAKKLVSAAGVPIVPFVEAKVASWEKQSSLLYDRIKAMLGYPVFVKPARLGSSVGITRVKTPDKIDEACRYAFQFDEKILIEKSVNAREIETAALGDDDPEISIPGEIAVTGAEYYDYETKYLDANAAKIIIPADLTPRQVKVVTELSKTVFQSLELYGMARIDFFLERETGLFFFNEANTIPGFTNISQYPKLWQASGVSSGELLDRLIDLALKRHHRRRSLKRSI